MTMPEIKHLGDFSFKKLQSQNEGKSITWANFIRSGGVDYIRNLEVLQNKVQFSDL